MQQPFRFHVEPLQNDFVFSQSLLYIDARGLSVDEVANKLAQTWRHPL